MSPIDWATRPLKKYADFSGRAPRAEYWWYALLVSSTVLIAYILDDLLSLPKLFTVYGPVALVVVAATFIPSLAAQVRRLHDTNRSGLWLIPFWVAYVAYIVSAAGSMAAIKAGQQPDMGALGISLVLGLLMLVIAITMLVFLVSRGTVGPNKYGDDPYASGASRAM